MLLNAIIALVSALLGASGLWAYIGKRLDAKIALSNKQEQSNFSSVTAKKGEIAVMSHGKYGHICMWNGRQWISDFKQNNMWPYSGNGVCRIFRYNA